MADERATQPGVQEREGGHVDESQDRPLTPREEALAAISRSRIDMLSEEIVAGGGEPLPDRDPPTPTVTKPLPTKQETTATQIEKQMRFEGDPTKTFVTVKIDGDEIQLPLDQVIANYQKGGAAERRFDEASRLRDEAQRALDAAKAGTPAPAAAPAATPAAAPTATKKTDARAFSAALFEGDEDKAASALEAFMDERARAAAEAVLAERGVDKATPELVADEVAKARQQEVVTNVLQASQAAYPELYADPEFQSIAAGRIERRMAEGIAWADALEEVSTSMATKYGWQKQGQPNARQSDRQRNERLEARKAGIDRLPTASARRVDSADTPPPMDELERAARGIEYLRKTRPSQSESTGG